MKENDEKEQIEITPWCHNNNSTQHLVLSYIPGVSWSGGIQVKADTEMYETYETAMYEIVKHV